MLHPYAAAGTVPAASVAVLHVQMSVTGVIFILINITHGEASSRRKSSVMTQLDMLRQTWGSVRCAHARIRPIAH